MPLTSLRRTLIASITSILLLPSIAIASPPANDDFDAATPIASLAFADTLSTVEATTAPDDPSCVGTNATVWYSFTPSADIRVDANTFGSDYDTTISAYTGARGSLTQLTCNDDFGSVQSQIIFNATAGTTYYIMVSTYRDSQPGNLNLTIQEAAPAPPPPPPPPPQPVISLSVDTVGSVDREGGATLRGSVSCDQQVDVRLDASLRQRFLRRFTLQGYGGTIVTCQPPSVRWNLSLTANNGRFGAGKAQFQAGAYACNNGGCAYEQQAGEIHLRGGP